MKTHHPQLPTFFPESWAESFGQDGYGIWHGIYVGDLEVRFRWIPPGEFKMGSPQDELERLEREGPQHPVRFEQGFWLAETACTQALWQAVMSKNLSRSQEDPQHPVEKVSWKMAKEFVEKLNQQAPKLGSRLPSEAEWEYACRAGTTTPFWFGTELTTEDSNYNGNYPYASGKKGEYRKKALPVKHFRSNPWGLYQMYGNAWEWCEDRWHDNYEDAPADGSVWAAGDSGYHVCRGGSWFNYGWDLRSAYRYGDRFAVIGDSVGLRLARGPELQPAQQES